jgi:hypothetical protein
MSFFGNSFIIKLLVEEIGRLRQKELAGGIFQN